MRYLLNLPLVIAALVQAWFVYLVLMPAPWPGWSDGPSRGAMALFMIQVALASWLPLLVAAVGAVFTDAFDWSPVVRRGRRRAGMLAATVVTAAPVAMCMVVALSDSAAVGGHDFAHYGATLVWSATIGGTVVPLAAIAWLGWLINAPPAWRHFAGPRRATLGLLAVTVLAGGIIGCDTLRNQIIRERELAERYGLEEDKNEAENMAHFASLTDASPLSGWGAYATNASYYAERFRPAEDEMRAEALRRLATRPTLEADIAKDLVASYTPDADIAFLLVARVQFAPSGALEMPLRRAMSRIEAEIRKAGLQPGSNWPKSSGDDEVLDSYIKSGYSERLTASLVIATRMADSAGVDLRDSLRELESAATEGYPKTKTAETYRRDVAATEQKIEAMLSAKRRTN
jgi:hypothetical protein